MLTELRSPSENEADLLHDDAVSRDLVVLTHGISSSKWFLLPLARRLRQQGFDTLLHSYFSLWGSNRQIGRRFARRLHRLAARYPDRTIHVVAHSMGSIVTRCALLERVPDSLGRIVMVGPPNRGSDVAQRISNSTGWLMPTLKELSDTPDSFVNQLPASVSPYDVGVVVASHDRVVRPECTTLDDLTDQVVLRGFHTGVLWRPETALHVGHFLRTGRFLAVE
ncbi:esterase/lipase family protein [Aeoliella mucimassa]|uniref:Alpha/beta hydrolase family protein n=1 Tax=Aeoliella mucimassa TaxID=2527972 RepID=A0A518AIE2_9BACT|nr:alpha/beta hydrolase [Aeoliella mucimassa]QDU54503.1 Alpha/beta hydrolase family protein [Aeoliella mucimassa]